VTAARVDLAAETVDRNRRCVSEWLGDLLGRVSGCCLGETGRESELGSGGEEQETRLRLRLRLCDELCRFEFDDELVHCRWARDVPCSVTGISTQTRQTRVCSAPTLASLHLCVSDMVGPRRGRSRYLVLVSDSEAVCQFSYSCSTVSFCKRKPGFHSTSPHKFRQCGNSVFLMHLHR
jgi:hypothetical protein